MGRLGSNKWIDSTCHEVSELNGEDRDVRDHKRILTRRGYVPSEPASEGLATVAAYCIVN